MHRNEGTLIKTNQTDFPLLPVLVTWEVSNFFGKFKLACILRRINHNHNRKNGLSSVVVISHTVYMYMYSNIGIYISFTNRV